MTLKIFLLLQILMGLWVLLNGFFAGEMGWIYSIVFWLISALLIVGSILYLSGKPIGRLFSLLGNSGLALATGSFLIYVSYSIFRDNTKFGIDGLYPFSIFSYAVFMVFYYARKPSLQ